jgi:hypothetical protein
MPGAVVYLGATDAFLETVAREGWRGLYAGLAPNLIKVTLTHQSDRRQEEAHDDDDDAARAARCSRRRC